MTATNIAQNRAQTTARPPGATEIVQRAAPQSDPS